MEKKSVREKIEEICNGRLPSLYDVATKIGFKKDPMECSQRSVCMRIGAAGGGEKILIYDNGQKYKNLRSGKCGALGIKKKVRILTHLLSKRNE